MMNSFTLLNNESRHKLIELIKQNPILWNKTRENYNKKQEKGEAWALISQEIGEPVAKLRRTWESLRDQYRRDLKREIHFGAKSKWRFFNDMEFIREMVKCKELQTNNNESDSEKHLIKNVEYSNMTNFAKNEEVFQPILLTRQPEYLALEHQDSINSSFMSSQYQQDIRHNTATPPHYHSPSTNVSESMRIANEEEIVVKNEPILRTDTRENMSINVTIPSPSANQIYGNSSEVLPYYSMPKPMINTDSSRNIKNASPQTVSCYNNTSSNFETRFSTTIGNESVQSQESCVSTSTDQNTNSVQEEHKPSASSSSAANTSNSMEEIKDDDYYFVLSLLPSLRQVPKHRKLPLRIGIMNLLAKDLAAVNMDVND